MTRQPRAQIVWDMHDLGAGRGLEVGPLDRPLVRRDEADVRYLDVLDTDGLRAHYGPDPSVVTENLVEVDYALIDGGRTRTVREAAGHDAPFAWVVACHVVEHVPDVVGWLGELAELVEDDGSLLLVVPDLRYTFDLHRAPTTLGAMVEAHDNGETRPSVRAVLDHTQQIVFVDAAAAWRGARPGVVARRRTLADAWADVRRTRDGEYVDCHVWTFTPDLFLTQLRDLRLSGLSAWSVEELVPTPRDELEFYVRLRRVPRGVDAAVADLPDELGPADERPHWMPAADAAEAEIERLRRRVRRQRKRLEAQRAELRALRSSTRWRVGSAVAAPVERLRRALRR